MLLLAIAAVAFAGAWAPFGAPPAGHRLVSEAVGPDLVRFEWESPEAGHYWVDVTPDRGGGVCRAAGLAVQVRRSLAADAESFELDPLPAPVTAVCDGLAAAAPTMHAAMAVAVAPDQTPDPDVLAPTGPVGSEPRVVAPLAIGRLRPWQLVVGVTVLAALATLPAWPRDRRLLVSGALAGGALAIRLASAPVTVVLGGDAAYERLVSALGRGAADRYYGETWLSSMGAVSAATRMSGIAGARATDFVHDVNLVASAAAPALLYALALRLGLPGRVALGAGVALVVWPQAVLLARMEDHAVLAGTLQLVAAVAVLGRSRAEAALAVGAAALLGHLRPDQGPVAALLLLPLAARRQWFAFGVGAALLAARLGYLPRPDHSPIDFGRLLVLRDWPWMVRAFWAPAGPLAPLGLALAGAGVLLAAAPRARSLPLPSIAWLAAIFAAVTLPYLPKDLPAADPLRFSLPALPWLILAAATGGVAAWRAVRVDRRVGAGLGVLGLAALVAPRAPDAHPRPWAWEGEYRFLLAQLPSPDGDPLGTPAATRRGWYDDAQDPNGVFGRWLSIASGMAWRPWNDGEPVQGDLVYRGTADRLADRWLGARCGLEPLAEEELAPLSDGWVEFGAAPVRVSLYRVRECGDAP